KNLKLGSSRSTIQPRPQGSTKSTISITDFRKDSVVSDVAAAAGKLLRTTIPLIIIGVRCGPLVIQEEARILFGADILKSTGRPIQIEETAKIGGRARISKIQRTLLHAE